MNKIPSQPIATQQPNITTMTIPQCAMCGIPLTEDNSIITSNICIACSNKKYIDSLTLANQHASKDVLEYVAWWMAINQNPLFLTLDNILPGLANFHIHRPIRPLSYLHIMLLTYKQQHAAIAAFNVLYPATPYEPMSEESFAAIRPQIKPFIHWFTRYKKCNRCSTFRQTYIPYSNKLSPPSDLSYEELFTLYTLPYTDEQFIEFFPLSFQSPRLRYIFPHSFERAQFSKDGWSKHCLTCKYSIPRPITVAQIQPYSPCSGSFTEEQLKFLDANPNKLAYFSTDAQQVKSNHKSPHLA